MTEQEPTDDGRFTYEYLGRCQFILPGLHGLTRCNEPAVYRAWWQGKKVDVMLLCEEHFQVEEMLWTEKEKAKEAVKSANRD